MVSTKPCSTSSRSLGVKLSIHRISVTSTPSSNRDSTHLKYQTTTPPRYSVRLSTTKPSGVT